MKSLFLASLLFLSSFALGQDKYDTLKLPTGEVYESVEIRSKALDGLKIVHATGASTIPWNKLPLEFQEKYKLSDKELGDLTAKKDLLDKQIKREKLIASAKEDRFRVVSIDPSGVLVQGLVPEYTTYTPTVSRMQSIGGAKIQSSPSTTVSYRANGPLYWIVGMPTTGLVDDARFKMKFVEIGTHTYKSVSGASKTVKKLQYVSHTNNIN